jgi:hypothetical protein
MNGCKIIGREEEKLEVVKCLIWKRVISPLAFDKEGSKARLKAANLKSFVNHREQLL